MPIDQRFEQLDATSREMLGYLSLAPVILTLDDMQKLLGSASRTATEITERVAALDDLLMESSAGYGFIHDSLRKQISERLMRHPQLNSLLTDRLSNLLADTGRSWAAFCLRRSEINERVARLANRAASEAVFTGSRRHLTETLEYLVVYYRSRSEKGRLVTVLLALAEVRANHGRASEAEVLLREARALTEQSADSEAEQMIDVLEALIDLRGSASATALARVRALRNKARADGQADLEGRLLLDEGVAYLGVNDTEASAPLFRRAREIFKNLDDVYGLEVATRNLIASLSITREGRAEAEALRASLDAEVSESPRYRAWLCNLDVPRLRIEKRYEEAQALAREAISIGIELGDDYLVAINQIVLGNVLRDARDFEGARTAYAKGSELGQSVGRRDIEGRSRRLLAAIDNQAAEAAIGKERLALAVRAEQNATHAADLLKESFAWIEQACALEERANALRLQDRDREAMSVYALAISGYSRGGDVTEVERLMRFFVNYISDEPDSMALIARAFDGRNDLTASRLRTR